MERVLLLELVTKYKYVIECKKNWPAGLTVTAQQKLCAAGSKSGLFSISHSMINIGLKVFFYAL